MPKVISINPNHTVQFDSSGEPIYGLMITGKDAFHAILARNAIHSFLSQTHGNRYLIIVNDGDFRFDVRAIPRDRIAQIQLSDRQVLGALRNRSLESVPDGALWVQWDDDDWHHPDLMAHQDAVLVESGAGTCFLRHQIKYAFSAWSESHFRLSSRVPNQWAMIEESATYLRSVLPMYHPDGNGT